MSSPCRARSNKSRVSGGSALIDHLAVSGQPGVGWPLINRTAVAAQARHYFRQQAHPIVPPCASANCLLPCAGEPPIMSTIQPGGILVTQALRCVAADSIITGWDFSTGGVKHL